MTRIVRAFACVTSFVLLTFVSVLAAVAPISAQCALIMAFVSVRPVLDSPIVHIDMLMPRGCVTEPLPVVIETNEQLCFLVHRLAPFRGLRE